MNAVVFCLLFADTAALVQLGDNVVAFVRDNELCALVLGIEVVGDGGFQFGEAFA